jgi:hypothetical protein
METPQSSATVRLLIFSGKPDPEWPLDNGTRDQLLARVRDVVGKKEGNPPPPPKLGYRGFWVRPGRYDATGLPEFSVSRGVVTTGGGRNMRHWQDVAGIEEMLLTQARERGFRDLLNELGVDINPDYRR